MPIGRSCRPAHYVALGLLALLTAANARGQATVTLEVGTDQPYVNEAVAVTIRVDNARGSKPPELPSLANCTVQYRGPGQRISIEQDSSGRTLTVRRLWYNYVLIAHQAGPLTIPAIPVVVDGKTLETKPRRLIVRELPESPSPRGGPDDAGGQASDLLLAEITCAQPKLFVGQRANFTLTVWIKPAQYRGRPLTKADMWHFKTGSFGPFDISNVRASEIKRPRDDGSVELYYVYELPADFVVQQAGPLTFSDVAVGMNYPTQFSRDIFGELRVARQQRVPRMRPAITIPDVQALPSEGRPASFSGAVGRYGLNVFAVPTNVRVGDPIQLVIDISGEPVEALPGPNLTAIPRLVEDFRVPNETLAGTVSGNRKRFTQTVRARRADVTEIPPIEFAYFDPQAGQYLVARSEPIPVLASAVEQLDATDLTGIAAEPTREHSRQLEARDGLRGNKTSETELLAAAAVVTMTQVVLATVVPPAAFMCVWGISALTRSRRDSAVQRRRAALRTAERRVHSAITNRLPPGEFHSEIEAALAGYLADRLNQPAARFLGHAAVTFLEERGVDQDLVQRCAELLQRCEQAAYAGGGESDTSLAELARQCARQLERERL